MINDLKLGLKVMKYGLNGNKGAVVADILCLVLGTVMEIFLPIGFFGGMWFGMIALFIVQVIPSVSVSTMVQSSSYKKKLQVTVPTIVGCAFLLIANTYSLLLKWVGYEVCMNWSKSDPDVLIIFEQGDFSTGIIFSSIVMVFIIIYMGVGLKYFGLSFLLMFGGIALYNYATVDGGGIHVTFPEGMAVVLSYVIILLGCGILYLILNGSYKKEYSKATFEPMLKRAS